MSVDEEFTRLTTPYRPELMAHCYRMLGSIHDAEDLVQETYLRAWRSYEGFEGRSSLRTWLYRIATSACLTALEHRSRRLLPSGLGGPSDNPDQGLTFGQSGVRWLQPIPDTLMDVTTEDPAAIVASRSSVRLALIAALQHLPVRQRVVLILRDVLAWRASEVAELLGTSTAAVNSALQRARTQLERMAPLEDEVAEPVAGERRALIDQYAVAFENADIEALLRLLRDDVALEMPPNEVWFAGRESVGRFLAFNILRVPGRTRAVLTTANGQPAVATYWLGDDGVFHAHGIQVLTVAPGGITRIVIFRDPDLFPVFGLAPTLEADRAVSAAAR
jgi:RNA polymerase sigma-70 factor, ECF subfamily